MNEAPDHPAEVCAIYEQRRDILCDGLGRIGWPVARPQGTMFVWAPMPEQYQDMGSIEFASMLVKEANVAVSPGIGFGPGGEGHVRFALIENEQRIQQAVRSMSRSLDRL
jgi:alanine-synthesizing transaminase